MTDPRQPPRPEDLPPGTRRPEPGGPTEAAPPYPADPSPGNPYPAQAAPGYRSAEPAAEPRTAETPAGFDDRGKVRRGKVSAVWVGLIAAAVFLILLIIFIAQNLTRASIHYLGFSGHLPLGLTVLIAAVIGVIIAAVPGSIRILQLRRALKRNAAAGSGGPGQEP